MSEYIYRLLNIIAKCKIDHKDMNDDAINKLINDMIKGPDSEEIEYIVKEMNAISKIVQNDFDVPALSPKPILDVIIEKLHRINRSDIDSNFDIKKLEESMKILIVYINTYSDDRICREAINNNNSISEVPGILEQIVKLHTSSQNFADFLEVKSIFTCTSFFKMIFEKVANEKNISGYKILDDKGFIICFFTKMDEMVRCACKNQYDEHSKEMKEMIHSFNSRSLTYKWKTYIKMNKMSIILNKYKKILSKQSQHYISANTNLSEIIEYSLPDPETEKIDKTELIEIIDTFYNSIQKDRVYQNTIYYDYIGNYTNF